MAHTKSMFSLGLLGFCLLVQLAWAQSPQITSIVFSPEKKTLWMETKNGNEQAIIYLSAKEAKVVQGKMSKDALLPPSNLAPIRIFEAYYAGKNTLLESQNSQPIAEQQALCDATMKLIAGDIGLQVLRTAKFAEAAQAEPSATLLAAIQKWSTGGNGGNDDRPAPASTAIGGNGGNDDRPTVSLKNTAPGAKGGNPALKKILSAIVGAKPAPKAAAKKK